MTRAIEHDRMRLIDVGEIVALLLDDRQCAIRAQRCSLDGAALAVMNPGDVLDLAQAGVTAVAALAVAVVAELGALELAVAAILAARAAFELPAAAAHGARPEALKAAGLGESRSVEADVVVGTRGPLRPHALHTVALRDAAPVQAARIRGNLTRRALAGHAIACVCVRGTGIARVGIAGIGIAGIARVGVAGITRVGVAGIARVGVAGVSGVSRVCGSRIAASGPPSSSGLPASPGPASAPASAPASGSSSGPASTEASDSAGRVGDESTVQAWSSSATAQCGRTRVKRSRGDMLSVWLAPDHGPRSGAHPERTVRPGTFVTRACATAAACSPRVVGPRRQTAARVRGQGWGGSCKAVAQ